MRHGPVAVVVPGVVVLAHPVGAGKLGHDLLDTLDPSALVERRVTRAGGLLHGGAAGGELDHQSRVDGRAGDDGTSKVVFRTRQREG